jgi:uncharacterized protein YndB with AHSA1/START domain
MNPLEHNLTRTVSIRAARSTVFTYFTDSARWADWWGAGSTIDAQPGGKVYIRHANGIEVGGEVLEVAGPDRIVFTYGFASGKPIRLGGSKVTVTLSDEGDGTLLNLLHEFDEATVRDQHIQGWRFQLSLFANAVLNRLHAEKADALIDAWHSVWNTTDDAVRAAELAKVATEDVEFHDRYSTLRGHEDLMAHIAASHRFMPGVALQRKGPVLHSQGNLLSAWSVSGPDGKEIMSGRNTYRLASDGRIESAVGFVG